MHPNLLLFATSKVKLKGQDQAEGLQYGKEDWEAAFVWPGISGVKGFPALCRIPADSVTP